MKRSFLMKRGQLDGLMAFTEVAQRRSFTAAAAALEVTPPAVSQAVKALESRLGVRLLHRTTRSVSLTQSGERYLARAAPALAELQRAAEELQGLGDSLAGRVRLNAPYVFHQILLRPALASFMQAHPGVQVELTLDDGFVDIVAQGHDLGVRLGYSVQRDMVALPITRRERTCMVASPAYAGRHGLPQSIDELAQHACVRYRFRTSGSIYRWELRQGTGLVEVPVEGPLTVADSLGLAQAALDGLGIAYAFERQVADDLVAGRLLPVLPETWPSFPGFHFYCSSRRQMPPAVRAFAEHCIAYWADR